MMELTARLDHYYDQVDAIILSRQNAATGLVSGPAEALSHMLIPWNIQIPASVAVTTHGDYTHAWTRDNVYSIYAVWGLALAYRRIDNDGGRACMCDYELFVFLNLTSSKDELENATKKVVVFTVFHTEANRSI
jgi:hypothetical protein